MRRRNFLKNSISLFGYGIFNIISKPVFQTYDFDIIIRDALIVDGSGKDGYSADIGIIGRIIAEIGNLKDYKAHRVINANGLIVSPGFVDIHSHSDDELLVNRSEEHTSELHSR